MTEVYLQFHMIIAHSRYIQVKNIILKKIRIALETVCRFLLQCASAFTGAEDS